MSVTQLNTLTSTKLVFYNICLIPIFMDQPDATSEESSLSFFFNVKYNLLQQLSGGAIHLREATFLHHD